MRLKLWLSLRDRRYNQGTWEGRALKFSSAAQGTVASRFDIEENNLTHFRQTPECSRIANHHLRPPSPQTRL